jgi:hypothetical protein
LGEEYKSFSSSLCNLLQPPVTSSLLICPYPQPNQSSPQLPILLPNEIF